MIRNGFLAAIAAAGLLIPALPAYSQTTISVEESTGARAVATDGSPINISIPRTRPSDIHLTTAADERTSDPNVDATGSIDLTPAQFRARREQELPVNTPKPMATPAPVTTQTTPTAQAKTPAPKPSTTPATAKPAQQDHPTTTSQNQPKTTNTETTKPKPAKANKKAAASKVKYLPPADLGVAPTIQRGDHQVPMLPEQLSSAPLALTVPDVFQTTLTNGMHFYHYESHDLPRVRVNLIIDAGQNADPADKIGLADLTMKTIRAGGAAGKSGDEIDEALDQIGADLTFSVDPDHAEASLFTLTERTTQAMNLLADILMKPELDKTRFEQQKARVAESLRRQNDAPADISRREFRKIVYGPDYPLARTATSATLANISLDDVRHFYEEHYRPSSIWIGVSGDIARDEAQKLIETTFAKWDRPAGERVAMPPVIEDSFSSPGVYLTRKATAQSQIRMGHLGLERRSPKAYAVNVLNSVYGMGGFSSRLMNIVRTKFGYVYGVGGGILSDDPKGMFLAAAASKSASTLAAIDAMLDVTKDIVKDGITEEELTTAKRDVVFNFVSQFETPEKIVSAHMLHDFRGYAPDYLKTFPERVRAVTAQQVAEVAKEFMHPDKLIIYVVGNPDAMDGPLDQFGPVHEWNLEEYTAEPGK